MHKEPTLVMLVEDNQDHAELVMRTLTNHVVHNQVIHFDNGQIVLDYLFEQGEYADKPCPRPHIILLDLRLPRVDGLELLKIIKSSTTLRTIPIVILTSSHAERDIIRAYDNHVNSYLIKPIGYDEFTHLMKDLGYYWLNWNTTN
ncbi:MAG: response regulator [Anaerolineae bacterium]|nr:response regulator [Anaerolineae bacterium]